MINVTLNLLWWKYIAYLYTICWGPQKATEGLRGHKMPHKSRSMNGQIDGNSPLFTTGNCLLWGCWTVSNYQKLLVSFETLPAVSEALPPPSEALQTLLKASPFSSRPSQLPLRETPAVVVVIIHYGAAAPFLLNLLNTSHQRNQWGI